MTARQLIDAHQNVLESEWGDAQPRVDDENAFLETHTWDEHAAWHLGLTDGATDERKPATPSSTATSGASTEWA